MRIRYGSARAGGRRRRVDAATSTLAQGDVIPVQLYMYTPDLCRWDPSGNLKKSITCLPLACRGDGALAGCHNSAGQKAVSYLGCFLLSFYQHLGNIWDFFTYQDCAYIIILVHLPRRYRIYQ